MQVYYRHIWDVNTQEAREIQDQLTGEVIRSGNPDQVKLVAGIDVSINRYGRHGIASIVILSWPALAPVETVVVEGEIEFPYVPGLLSFREGPLILAACETVTAEPDLIFIDGHGIAHPRRLGLAAHLGLCLQRPTIGVAKSKLCGEYEEPGEETGSLSNLEEDREVIGMVVRTKTGVKPVFVSIGNMISLDQAVAWTLNCCRGYRLPEPTRQAHNAAITRLKSATE